MPGTATKVGRMGDPGGKCMPVHNNVLDSKDEVEELKPTTGPPPSGQVLLQTHNKYSLGRCSAGFSKRN